MTIDRQIGAFILGMVVAGVFYPAVRIFYGWLCESPSSEGEE